MDSHPKIADDTPEVLPVGGGQQPPDASPSKAQLLEVFGLLSRQLLDGGNSISFGIFHPEILGRNDPI